MKMSRTPAILSAYAKTSTLRAPSALSASHPGGITFINALSASATNKFNATPSASSLPIKTPVLTNSPDDNPLAKITFVNAISSSSSVVNNRQSSVLAQTFSTPQLISYTPTEMQAQTLSSALSSSSGVDSSFRPIAASPAPSNASSSSLGPFSRPSFDDDADDDLDDRFRPSPTPNSVSLSSYKNKTVYNRTNSPLESTSLPSAVGNAASPSPLHHQGSSSSSSSYGNVIESSPLLTGVPTSQTTRFDNHLNNSRFEVAGSKTYARKRKFDDNSSLNGGDSFEEERSNVSSEEPGGSNLDRPPRSPSPVDNITRDEASSSIMLNVRVKADMPNETGVPISSSSHGQSSSGAAATSTGAPSTSSSAVTSSSFHHQQTIPPADADDALLESVLRGETLSGAASRGTATPTSVSANTALDEELLHCSSEENDFLHQAAETLLSLTGAFTGDEDQNAQEVGGEQAASAVASNAVTASAAPFASGSAPSSANNSLAGSLESSDSFRDERRQGEAAFFGSSGSHSFSSTAPYVAQSLAGAKVLLEAERSHSNSPLDLSFKRESTPDEASYSLPAPAQSEISLAVLPGNLVASAYSDHASTASSDVGGAYNSSDPLIDGDAMRRRFIVSPDEKRDVLLDFLKKTNNYEPSREQIADLARQSNVPEKKVNKWFQNKRSTTSYRSSRGLPPLPSSSKSPTSKLKRQSSTMAAPSSSSSSTSASLDERSNRVLQMLEQWYELQEFDRLPYNEGPTLAQLEAIGIQVGIPVKTAAEWFTLRRQKSLLAAKRASEDAISARVDGALHQPKSVQQQPAQVPVQQMQQDQHHTQQASQQQQQQQQEQMTQQKRAVKKNAPKEAPGWDVGGKNRLKQAGPRKLVLGQRLDDNSSHQRSNNVGAGAGKLTGYQVQLENWFVVHKTGFPAGKEIDRLMKLTNKSRDFIVEWCKNRRKTKVEKMQTCLVSDIQTAILEHWFITNRSAMVGQNINQPLLTNR